MTASPTVSTARYAKGMMAVRCPSSDGLKSRAACLAVALKGRFSNREHAYIMSPRKAERLAALYADGWDATWDGALIPPPEAP